MLLHLMQNSLEMMAVISHNFVPTEYLPAE